nr:LLM class flavin-dependent oxidoreductase [Mycolicibacter heraklionensis]
MSASSWASRAEWFWVIASCVFLLSHLVGNSPITTRWPTPTPAPTHPGPSTLAGPPPETPPPQGTYPRFADPKKVQYVNHRGHWLSVRGPLQVPRSRQGEPVILQAGLSPRGRRFAGRWAEAVFSVSPNLDIMRAVYQDIKAHVAAAGRDPEQTKVFTAVMPVLGETEQVARERLEYLNSLVHPEVGLSTLSSHSGLNLSKYPLDTKFSDIVADLGDRHVPTMLQMFSAVAGGGADLTLAELGRRYGTNVGFVPQWAGTAEQIADQLVSHFEAGAADGFIISAAYLPGVYEEFVDQVVPLLQQRGVFRTEYEGATLREHLGLARPEVGSI